MKSSPLLFFFLFCVLFSCQKKKASVQNAPSRFDTVAIHKKDKETEKIVERQVVERIEAKAIKFPDLSKFSALPLDSLTANIYKANAYMSFWHDSAKCYRAIQVLKNARFDGLMPKDYGIPALERMFELYFMEGKQTNDTLQRQNEYWQLELALTKNYLHYLNDLRFGKTNPEAIFKDWDYKREFLLPYTPAEFAKLMNQNFYALVSEFRPQYPMYDVLRSVLYMLDSAKKTKNFAQTTWDAIPYIGKDLVLGDTSWVIGKIKQRLLSVEFTHEDTLIHEDTVTNIFNDELLAILNYFQQHVGLTPNGKIDRATTTKLNFTLQTIEDAARVNMERCRWLLKGELPDYYIVVNIADYTLRVYKNGKEVHKTKVIVGATNKETPMFHSEIATVEFNPYWNVPKSIARDELLPKLKANPNYLSKNNMDLFKESAKVWVTDFSPYSRGYFPFLIRQRPGADNSLGRVKFVFPNRYSVYLHDTPSKSLFEKDVRTFSHGCIRVQKPMEIAELLLSEQGMTVQDMTLIVESEINTPIRLKTKVPIIITYWTCFTDEKNHVFFFKDIYGRDKAILRALNN